MGVQGYALHQPRALRQVVTTHVRHELQDAYAGRPRSTRLPARRERRIPALHHAPAPKHSVKDALLPGRGPLGAEAAKFTALVQDCQRLGRSVDEEIERSIVEAD